MISCLKQVTAFLPHEAYSMLQLVIIDSIGFDDGDPARMNRQMKMEKSLESMVLLLPRELASMKPVMDHLNKSPFVHSFMLDHLNIVKMTPGTPGMPGTPAEPRRMSLMTTRWVTGGRGACGCLFPTKSSEWTPPPHTSREKDGLNPPIGQSGSKDITLSYLLKHGDHIRKSLDSSAVASNK